MTNISDTRFDIGEWFPQQDGYRDVVRGHLAWDIYFLYGPEAEWTDVPSPLLSSGATISGTRDRLHEAVLPLLSEG